MSLGGNDRGGGRFREEQPIFYARKTREVLLNKALWLYPIIIIIASVGYTGVEINL